PGYADAAAHAGVRELDRAVVYDLGFLHSAAPLLARKPGASGSAGPDRPRAGYPADSGNRGRREFPELPLSPDHYRGLHPAASRLGLSDSGVCLPALWLDAGAELFRDDSLLHRQPPGVEVAAGHYLYQSLRLPDGRLSGGTARDQAAPGWRPARGHQRRLERLKGPARKHHSIDQRRDRHDRSG